MEYLIAVLVIVAVIALMVYRRSRRPDHPDGFGEPGGPVERPRDNDRIEP